MYEKICGREQDLVAYLYGEAGATEALDFRRHLSTCATCARDATAFGFVRDEVAELREAAPALNHTFADLDFANTLKPNGLKNPMLPTRSWRQARLALANLFRVSPRWLQASAVTAGLTLCALISLLFFSFDLRTLDSANNTGAPVVPSAAVGSPVVTLTQVELDAYIAREVERRAVLARQDTTSPTLVASAPEPTRVGSRQAVRIESASSQPGGRGRRTIAASRLQRPVARSRATDRDDELPRLSDLLDGAD